MSTEKSSNALRLLAIGLLALGLGLPVRAWAANPDQFAGGDVMLDRNELIRFLLVEKGVTYADIDKAGGDIQRAKEARYLLIELAEVKRRFGQEPYTPHEAAAVAQGTSSAPKNERQDSDPLDGILRYPKPRKAEKGQLQRGPILLREKLVDWSKKLDKGSDKVSGVSLSFNRDRETGKDTWLSKGTIIYPFKREVQRNAREVDQGQGLYDYWALLPSVVWNYNQVNGDGDIEELRFQLPVTRRGSCTAFSQARQGASRAG